MLTENRNCRQFIHFLLKNLGKKRKHKWRDWLSESGNVVMDNNTTENAASSNQMHNPRMSSTSFEYS